MRREAFDETVGNSIGADDAQAAGRSEDFDFPTVAGSDNADDSGCQVAPGRTSLPALIFLGLFGLGLATIRRA